jgi:hypothetical protein
MPGRQPKEKADGVTPVGFFSEVDIPPGCAALGDLGRSRLTRRRAGGVLGFGSEAPLLEQDAKPGAQVASAPLLGGSPYLGRIEIDFVLFRSHGGAPSINY